MTNTRLMAFRISDEQRELLTEAALANGLTVSEWVRVAIRKQLEGPSVPSESEIIDRFGSLSLASIKHIVKAANEVRDARWEDGVFE